MCAALFYYSHSFRIKHSVTSLDEGMEFFGFKDYDDFYHTDYYESNILSIGQQLADLYEDFYQSSKNFEKNFNDKDYLKETGISISNFELKKREVHPTMIIHLIFIV